MQQFDSKDPSEVYSVDFDFVKVLKTGETINTGVVTASALEGVDNTPSNIISGAVTISGTKVYQEVHNGIDKVIYKLRLVITTSAGRTLVRSAALPVMVK